MEWIQRFRCNKSLNRSSWYEFYQPVLTVVKLRIDAVTLRRSAKFDQRTVWYAAVLAVDAKVVRQLAGTSPSSSLPTVVIWICERGRCHRAAFADENRSLLLGHSWLTSGNDTSCHRTGVDRCRTRRAGPGRAEHLQWLAPPPSRRDGRIRRTARRTNDANQTEDIA